MPPMNKKPSKSPGRGPMLPTQDLLRETMKEVQLKLTNESLYDKVLNRKKKNQKMPPNMLKGIRNKKIQTYKQSQEDQRLSGGHFSSASLTKTQNLDIDFYLKKKEKQKYKNLHTEEKSYKYKGMNPVAEKKKIWLEKRGLIGGKKNKGNKGEQNHEGFLKVSKREIKSVNGQNRGDRGGRRKIGKNKGRK